MLAKHGGIAKGKLVPAQRGVEEPRAAIGSVWNLPGLVCGVWFLGFIAQEVYMNSFLKSRLRHKSVNLSFLVTCIKNE